MRRLSNRRLTECSFRPRVSRVGHATIRLVWAAHLGLLFACAAASRPAGAAQGDGSGEIAISGELKQWHQVTLTLDGPLASEADEAPNPFTDYRLTVTFCHESGTPRYAVPGYFAADGDAANSSARAGTKWRAHLSPDKPGRWTYQVAFVRGPLVAVEASAAGQPVAACDGRNGSFEIAPSDKTGRDFRGEGRLQYVGKHHLRFAGSGRYFLKAGPDAPETLLAYADFDGTQAGQARQPRPGEATPGKQLHRYEPHLADWRPGDPTWKDGRGKALIGALNYLAGKGCNAFSFLPYNAGGDGDNVWPFVARDDKLHYDCSKLGQWQIVFDHAQRLGLYLHFKLQETEIDDNRGHGKEADGGPVAAALDGGDLGVERKLYCRELIARFGSALALNWNLGEENTQTPAQQRAMAQYIHDTDPYDHLIVVHTFPNWQDRVYPELLGERSVLTGASLQNGWNNAHQRTLQWVTESAKADRPWVVANDEQNPASLGVPPDPGYAGFSGRTEGEGPSYDLHDIRKATLWGTLLAGGAGVEYYFGYKLPQNDLVCEDFRSRDRSWDYCRIALEFFREHDVPFWDMANADELVGNAKHDNSKYCLAQAGTVYLVYLPQGGTAELDLTGASGTFRVQWFDPRSGGPLQAGSVTAVAGGNQAALGGPPKDATDDWVVLVRR